jgi:hypothetical protein
LRTFRATVAGLRDLPDEIRVVPWGRNLTPNGLLVVDDYTARVFAANQTAMGFDQTHGDFEHNSVPREGFVPPEPQEIACEGRFEVRTPAQAGGIDKAGLYFIVSEWKESSKYVAAGNYPDVSVACEQDGKGRILYAHSFAFCRHGAVTNARTFSVALPPLPSSTRQPTDNDTHSMSLKNALISALRENGQDIADDADDATLIASLTSAGGDMKRFTAAINLALKPFGAQLAKVTEKLEGIETRAADAERDLVIADLTRRGVKIPVSAEGLKKFSADELRKESKGWPAGEVPAEDEESAADPAAGTVKTFSNKGGDAKHKASVAAQLGLDAKDL